MRRGKEYKHDAIPIIKSSDELNCAVPKFGNSVLVAADYN